MEIWARKTVCEVGEKVDKSRYIFKMELMDYMWDVKRKKKMSIKILWCLVHIYKVGKIMGEYHHLSNQSLEIFQTPSSFSHQETYNKVLLFLSPEYSDKSNRLLHPHYCSHTQASSFLIWMTYQALLQMLCRLFSNGLHVPIPLSTKRNHGILLVRYVGKW